MASEDFEQEMRKSWGNANWLNVLIKEEDEEEALSLRDLPIVNDLQSPPRKESPKSMELLEEFTFCSSGRDSLFNESELCAADEAFFKGQIVFKYVNQIKSVSNEADSIDHCSSGGFTSGSSRNSSINSRYSSSSVNSSTSSAPVTAVTGSKNKFPVLNHFQFSQPSPKPQIRQSSKTKTGNLRNPNTRSNMWSLFRVGLVTTREIDIQKLKFRTNNSRTSRNSNNGEKKKKKSLFNKNGVLFGSCKCSANAIGTVDSRIPVMKKSQSAKEEHCVNVEKDIHIPAGKQSLSCYRTFEWLNIF